MAIKTLLPNVDILTPWDGLNNRYRQVRETSGSLQAAKDDENETTKFGYEHLAGCSSATTITLRVLANWDDSNTNPVALVNSSFGFTISAILYGANASYTNQAGNTAHTVTSTGTWTQAQVNAITAQVTSPAECDKDAEFNLVELIFTTMSYSKTGAFVEGGNMDGGNFGT